MGGAIASNLWNRSVSRNKLVYSTCIGDGDSSSFKRLVLSDPYKEGLENIRKEECLGHVQKRLKSHLKKASHTYQGIAKSKVQRVGQLYALVSVQNPGKSAEEMHHALFNLIDYLAEKHANCPCNTSSWFIMPRHKQTPIRRVIETAWITETISDRS